MQSIIKITPISVRLSVNKELQSVRKKKTLVVQFEAPPSSTARRSTADHSPATSGVNDKLHEAGADLKHKYVKYSTTSATAGNGVL
jgi:hypothetical protein